MSYGQPLAHALTRRRRVGQSSRGVHLSCKQRMPSSVSNIWCYADARASGDGAVTFAIELARMHGAALSFVCVMESPGDRLLHSPVGKDLVRMLEADKIERLQRMEEQARASLPESDVSRTVLRGEVAWYTLTASVMTHRPDLVIVAAEENPDADLFGTLSQHLFRKCPVPVWSIPASSTRFPLRALLAIDPGAKSSDARLLSREVLRLAMVLSEGTGIELHIGHAWDLWGERMIATKYGEAGTEALRQIQQEYARADMDELLLEGRCADRIASVHYPQGEPRGAIPKLADEIEADIVFLGSAARRGFEGFFIGSVAETIISRLGCSALVIKRPGFESPVRAG